MKQLIKLIIISSLLGSSLVANPNVVVESMAALPAGVVIDNANTPFSSGTYDNTTNLRFTGVTAADYKALVQSFVSDRQQAIAGIGFRISQVHNHSDTHPVAIFKEPQRYQLVVGHADGRFVERLILNRSILVTPEMIQGGNFLYFKFSNPLYVNEGDELFLWLRPVDQLANNRLFLDYSEGVDTYADGNGYQGSGLNPPSGQGELLKVGKGDVAFFATGNEQI